MSTYTLIAEYASASDAQQQEQQFSPYPFLIMIVLIFGVLLLIGWRRRSRNRRRLQEHKVTINLKCPICGEVISTPILPPPLLHDGVKVGQTASCQSCGKVSLVGIPTIGGWLIFPTMGLIVGPLVNIAYVVPIVADYGLRGLLAFNVALLVGFIMFQVCVAVLFLMNKPYTPKLVIALLLANFALIAYLSAAVDKVGAEDRNRVAGALVFAAVWIPYFLVSKRVKATFGRRGIAQRIKQ